MKPDKITIKNLRWNKINGKRLQVNVPVSPELLAQIDELKDILGVTSRGDVIRCAIEFAHSEIKKHLTLA
tara:strand:- start:20 stop:229 length:210 start_codon:yes stop_codon:yes gene_type:complete